MLDTECKNVALFAFNIKQRDLFSKPALNISNEVLVLFLLPLFLLLSFIPGCQNLSGQTQS